MLYIKSPGESNPRCLWLLRDHLLFCVQHLGIHSVSPATHVDPDYAKALEIASDKGVEILAYACETDLLTMAISHRIAFDFRGRLNT